MTKNGNCWYLFRYRSNLEVMAVVVGEQIPPPNNFYLRVDFFGY